MVKKYRSKKHKEGRYKKVKLDLVIYSLFFVCFISAVAYFTRYDSFEFQEVIVVGASDDYEENLKTFVEDSINSTMFLGIVSRKTAMTYPKGYIKNEVLNMFPKIDRVSVKSVGDNILKIVVSEKGPYSLWCTDKCYLVDVIGVAFEEVSEGYTGEGLIYINDSFNNIILGEPVVSVSELDKIKYLIQEIFEGGYDISEFKISPEGFYEIQLTSNTILKFIQTKDLEVQMENFKSTFSQRNGNEDIGSYEYIDLRFENRIYTKDKAFEEVEEELID